MKNNILKTDLDFVLHKVGKFCKQKEKEEKEENRKRFLRYLYFKKMKEEEE